jgi:hypothetical protein
MSATTKVIRCTIRGRTKRYISYCKAQSIEDRLIDAIDRKNKKSRPKREQKGG